MLCRRFLFVAALLWLMASALQSQENTHIYVTEDDEGSRLLAHADELAAAKKWTKAAEGYDYIIHNFPRFLYKVDGECYVNMRRYATHKLANGPAELLAAYRLLVDAEAKRQWLLARRSNDERLLRGIAENYFNSSYGDDALNAAGDLLLEKGQVRRALVAWSYLLDSHPDTDIDRGLVTCKVAVCLGRMGAVEQLNDLAAKLNDQELSQRVVIAGMESSIAEYLASQVEAARVQTREENVTWPTLGGSNDHTRVPSVLGGVDTVLWSESLRSLVSQSGQPARRSPPFYGTLDGSDLVVQDGEALATFDLLTGEKRWSAGVATKPGRPQRPLCFASIKPSNTVQGNRRAFATSWGNSGSSTLVAIDLADGRMAWSVSCQNLGGKELTYKHLRNGRFATPPLVNSETSQDGHSSVYILVTPHDGKEIYLASMEADSGKLRWIEFVCGFNPEKEHRMMPIPAALASDGEVIYISTNSGAIAAVDALDGSVLWVCTYPSTSMTEETDSSRAFVADSSLIINDGRLVIMPSDNDLIYCFDIADGAIQTSGDLLWSRARADTRFIMGADDGWIYLAGKYVMRIRAEDGSIGWTFEVPEHEFIGRGVVTREEVFHPTRKGLYRINRETGVLLDFFPWLGAEMCGNLVWAGDRLVSVGRHFVSVLLDGEKRRAELEAELQGTSRKRHRALLELGNLRAVRGQWEGAVGAFRRASAAAEEENPEGWKNLVKYADTREFDVLRDHAVELIRSSRSAGASRILKGAFSLGAAEGKTILISPSALPLSKNENGDSAHFPAYERTKLWNSDVVSGEIVSVSEEAITMRTPYAEKCVIKRKAALALVFSEGGTMTLDKSDKLIFHNGDVVTGTLISISGGKIIFEGLFGRLSAERDSIVRITFGQVKSANDTSVPDGPDVLTVRALLSNGDRITGEFVGLNEHSLLIKHAYSDILEINLEHVYSLTVRPKDNLAGQSKREAGQFLQPPGCFGE